MITVLFDSQGEVYTHMLDESCKTMDDHLLSDFGPVPETPQVPGL